ncbi:putative glycosidase crf1 [Smittium culicis]|uniref:Putative glycosidase crf1 n=1 Tax=Smittium culicis TaxID=133412 RepID=A0A1R1X886_9FUNG|nr:putative glycosidase crf1 [Smittium culicis]
MMFRNNILFAAFACVALGSAVPGEVLGARSDRGLDAGMQHTVSDSRVANGSPSVNKRAITVYTVDFAARTGLNDITVSRCSKNANYTTGFLDMQIDATCGLEFYYKYKITTGKIEALMKVPTGNGVVTGISMYGQNGDEIDIEVQGSNTKQMMDMYYYKGTAGLTAANPIVAPNSVDLSADFHTYGIELLTNSINWYLDGVLVQTVSKTDAAKYPTLAGDFPMIGLYTTSRFGSDVGTPDYTGGPKHAYIKWAKFTHY